MATRHSELPCQYGKEKRGTLFSVGNGASYPIGRTEAANARAPLGRAGSQHRHGSRLSLDGKQIRNRPQIGENTRYSFEANTLFDEIELNDAELLGQACSRPLPDVIFRLLNCMEVS